MTSDKIIDCFSVKADASLHQAILAARAAGKRYGGKLISCTVAYELGARVLLGLEESEEELVLKDLEDIYVQKRTLETTEKLKREQLQKVEVAKTAKYAEADLQNVNVQKVAHQLIKIWEKVTIGGNYRIINSVVDIDPKNLTYAKVKAIFSVRHAPKPSFDEAVIIANNLYNCEGVLCGV